MAIANLALRFILELVGIAFVAIWASTLAAAPASYALAVLATAAFSLAWGQLLAPTARSGLTQQRKGVLGTAALLAAAFAIAAAGNSTIALVYGAAVLGNGALLLALGDASERALAALDRPVND